MTDLKRFFEDKAKSEEEKNNDENPNKDPKPTGINLTHFDQEK